MTRKPITNIPDSIRQRLLNKSKEAGRPYDIWLLSKRRSFQGEVLAAAVTTTFRKRRTPLPVETPAALTTAFFNDQTKIKQWIAFLNQ